MDRTHTPPASPRTVVDSNAAMADQTKQPTPESFMEEEETQIPANAFTKPEAHLHRPAENTEASASSILDALRATKKPMSVGKFQDVLGHVGANIDPNDGTSIQDHLMVLGCLKHKLDKMNDRLIRQSLRRDSQGQSGEMAQSKQTGTDTEGSQELQSDNAADDEGTLPPYDDVARNTPFCQVGRFIRAPVSDPLLDPNMAFGDAGVDSTSAGLTLTKDRPLFCLSNNGSSATFLRLTTRGGRGASGVRHRDRKKYVLILPEGYPHELSKDEKALAFEPLFVRKASYCEGSLLCLEPVTISLKSLIKPIDGAFTKDSLTRIHNLIIGNAHMKEQLREFLSHARNSTDTPAELRRDSRQTDTKPEPPGHQKANPRNDSHAVTDFGAQGGASFKNDGGYGTTYDTRSRHTTGQHSTSQQYAYGLRDTSPRNSGIGRDNNFNSSRAASSVQIPGGGQDARGSRDSERRGRYQNGQEYQVQGAFLRKADRLDGDNRATADRRARYRADAEYDTVNLRWRDEPRSWASTRQGKPPYEDLDAPSVEASVASTGAMLERHYYHFQNRVVTTHPGSSTTGQEDEPPAKRQKSK
ncbi:unnamed protein product [Zymoseptoria tritici ST99CH_3D7]|uniref:Uncharacterized protein n=3 Tax=Zymoseptoria tritici TaxID=1047171 RepID=A0A1X7S1S2_ZYMT9|nr:unnamed protein product [Zymoseptoria tritici ST99CH_3D7]